MEQQAADQPRLLRLPPAPADQAGEVKAWAEPVVLSTYVPEAADRNPMFLEKRVYQGSSGRVYPLPFIDRIATEPVERAWQAVHLENRHVRLMVLPEIGGRIHVGLDKHNGFDFFYRQNVIKPALVGLAGPWISGGVEFNWPQHHRPATFLPVEVEIERHDDGSVTVWCSDHDPMTRMKGMHGICLYPDRALIELKVRLYNRTAQVQTFLWWANVAARVHERYQSFFPGDVRFVADHAKRATTSFPLSTGTYYGVDYGERARTGVAEEEQPRLFVPDGSYPANDLSWYANIPVPTSYMITASSRDFFGGYDHAAQAGVVHVADHHVAPGKKQWTWGNHEFGYAWDRSLTESDGPYIELMAGVYTDNQPDFSFLAPGETKSFSQFWYPIRGIGVPQAANLQAAMSLRVEERTAHIGICATREIRNASLWLKGGDSVIGKWTAELHIEDPMVVSQPLTEQQAAGQLSLVLEADGVEILSYDSGDMEAAAPPEVATEPPLPEAIASNEELYLTGLHLEQYRHATRSPEPYWREALRRDAGDSRAHNALGLWHLRRGEWAPAEDHFRAAIARLTERNPNPYDGEPYYNLGLTLRFLGRTREAYGAFYKATWNAAWRGPAYHALAEADASAGNWTMALDHVRRALRADADNLNARNLLVMVLRRVGLRREADAVLAETRALDRLDNWSRFLATGELPKENQQRLDLAFDLARACGLDEAIEILSSADLTRTDGSVPMLLYTLGYLHARHGNAKAAARAYERGALASPDYAFPSRLEELCVLEAAVTANPADGYAHAYLGNLLYDRRRHEEAIAHWESASRLAPLYPTVWRNLGVAYFNIRAEADKASTAYDLALALDPRDARILYERDQLWKRTGQLPKIRLAQLEKYPSLLIQRDDLAVELATLYNQTEQPERALGILLERRFQPWEGGEGLVLGQYVRTNLLLGQRALMEGDCGAALGRFEAALRPPESLGEARHLLANPSDVYYWLGLGAAVDGDAEAAERAWQRAASHRGDFQQMSVRTVSEMTYWSALADARLGNANRARRTFHAIHNFADALEREEPKIDYFATSLPAMLLFNEDLKRRNAITANLLRGQALLGFGRTREAERLLHGVLEADKSHAAAHDLLNLLRIRPALVSGVTLSEDLQAAAIKPRPTVRDAVQ